MVWLLIYRYLKKHLFYLSVQHQDSIIELQSGKITQLQSELEEMKKSCVNDESSVTQQGNCPSSRQLSRHLIRPICSVQTCLLVYILQTKRILRAPSLSKTHTQNYLTWT